MNLQSIKKSVHKAFFPIKFKNQKVEELYNFISQNDSDIEYWKNTDLLDEFINIIKDFNQHDVRYFFRTIKWWNSYHLVIIADKLLDNNVKSSVKYDFGFVYCKIFCLYEKFDSYFLIDNLEIAVNMYNSGLDLNILADLTAKVNFLFQHKQITQQQFQHSLSFINHCTDELSN
ncbi:hypothetical protein [Chryseobacterium sp. FH2]|uniref:hypothetical protein n=1 Tax=Chryseobacterium sp. FH2 TaxID=1674291 RepID=UPI00103ABA26|nr:hypothetical protein [Chryseobacterium sp. FH2]